MKKIEEKMQDAATQREEMRRLQEIVTVEKETTTAQKVNVESELGTIQPLIDAAREAVGSLNRRNFDEIRILRTPRLCCCCLGFLLTFC